MQQEHFDIVKFQQIPKEFQPNHRAHKSPWAIILLIIALLLAGTFLYIRKQHAPVALLTDPAPQEHPTVDVVSLEQSAQNIFIPDYTSIF